MTFEHPGPCQTTQLLKLWKEIFGEYVQVLKLKPVQFLLFSALFALICNTMMSSDLMYYFTYNQGLSAGETSLMFLFRSVTCVILIMLVKRLAAGRDKRAVLLTIYGVGGAALIVNKFISPDNMGELIVFVVLAVIAVTMYWQFMPAIVYDVCEYDELETGKQRQGAIVSLLSLVEAFAAGLG